MNLSRKDFFKQSLFKIGEAVGTVTGLMETTPTDEPAITLNTNFEPSADMYRIAVAHNANCLAKNCGCFACVEYCETQAIMVVMGEGIRIDASRCNGCGKCAHICPVTPKAVTLETRDAQQPDAP